MTKQQLKEKLNYRDSRVQKEHNLFFKDLPSAMRWHNHIQSKFDVTLERISKTILGTEIIISHR